MTQPAPSPLAAPEPWDIVADAYAEEVAPMFESFAREALDVADVSEGTRVADVAAGPGTLALLAAQRGAKVCAVDFSESMLRQLRARASGLGLHVDAVHGDGTKLPWASASFDAGFSMFGLMFFPDRHAGFRELARVLRPGARAVVSSWVDMTKLPLLAAVFGTFGESMPGPASPPREMPLADPETCRAEMAAGGFTDVTVRESSFTFPVPSTADLVDSMIRTNAPVALAREQMGEGWPAVESKWRELLQARIGDGPHELMMPAHLICGVR
jgi:SAM-dependent methyltransferase